MDCFTGVVLEPRGMHPVPFAFPTPVAWYPVFLNGLAISDCS